MRTVREAMVVAGGAGTRLRPLTDATPKPLLPVGGAPFLLGVIERLAAVGVEHVLLVVGADPRPFEDLSAAAAAIGVQLSCVPEPEPLDTAGGVRAALDQVTGTFLVLNGDILTDVDLTAAVAAHQAADAIATLVLTRVEDTSTYGVCVLDGDHIVGFVEKPPPGSLPGQDAVNAGTYVLEPDALARYPRGRLSFERQVFPDLVASGAVVRGVVHEGVWADLGTPARFRLGNRLALSGELDWPPVTALPAAPGTPGVRLDPTAHVAEGARLVGPVLLRAGVEVGPGAVLGPHVVAGAGTRIGAGARCTDTVLADGVGVGAGASLEGVLVGARARIGAGAQARGDVVVAAGAEVAPGARLAPNARLTAGPSAPG